MNLRLEGSLDDFVFMGSPKVTLPFKKSERGTHTKLVTVHRGGKTFERKQRVGRKEKDKEVIDKIPTREEFYSQEYWFDPKRGSHPASGSGRLPTKDIASLEVISISGEPVIRIYNPYTKEEIYYYDLKQMNEAKERFKNLYDETFSVKKSSLHPDNLQGIDDLNESGIVGLVGGMHESETYICRFKDGSSAIHKTMQAGDIIGEVGAYETSKILGWDIVPETIQCDYGKGEGSCQKWIPDGCEPFWGINHEGELTGIREQLKEKHLDDLSKIFILDMITGNFDRHDGNIIIDRNDKCWAIDNEMIGKLNNAQIHSESLNEWAKDGEGSFVPIISVLKHSFGNDKKMYQNFKNHVDKNIKQAIQNKDKIIKYWSQYKDSKSLNTSIPIKESIKNIQRNIEYLEYYQNMEMNK